MEKKRIFVANDDAAYLHLMEDLLEDSGYDVAVVKSSHNAYEEITDTRPDLLILDIVLEHPDAGWRVLDMIKLNPETERMPVIICSGDSRVLRDADRQEHLRSMGCLVVEKPFDLGTMLGTIREALLRADPFPD